MDEDADYAAWSPYVVRDVSSPAVTAAPGDSDEEIRSLAGPDLSYVPIPGAEEYYDLANGCRRPLDPGQVVPPDRPLLAGVEALVEHPFLLVTGDDPDSGTDYRIVTPADLNRRTAEAAFYPVLSTLAERLGDLIADEYPDPEDLVPLVGPFPVGSWTKARANDVEVHIADFLSLADMIGVLKGNDRLLSALGYGDPDELESDLYAISDLRNRVMHGNRPLVLDSDDVGTHVDRLHTAIDLIRRVERHEGIDRPSRGPP